MKKEYTSPLLKSIKIAPRRLTASSSANYSRFSFEGSDDTGSTGFVNENATGEGL